MGCMCTHTHTHTHTHTQHTHTGRPEVAPLLRAGFTPGRPCGPRAAHVQPPRGWRSAARSAAGKSRGRPLRARLCACVEGWHGAIPVPPPSVCATPRACTCGVAQARSVHDGAASRLLDASHLSLHPPYLLHLSLPPSCILHTWHHLRGYMHHALACKSRVKTSVAPPHHAHLCVCVCVRVFLHRAAKQWCALRLQVHHVRARLQVPHVRARLQVPHVRARSALCIFVWGSCAGLADDGAPEA